MSKNAYERAKINFGHPLGAEDVEVLFQDIVTNTNYSITYSIEHGKEVGESGKKTRLPAELRSIRISGSVWSLESGLESFSCQPASDDPTKIVSIDFLTIPGYSLEEHRKGEIELWDNIRKEVEQYFAEKVPI